MRPWLLIPLLLLFVGCSPKAITFVNDEADFASYARYLIRNFKVPNDQVSPEGQRLLIIIEDAIQEQMSRRGYELVRSQPHLIMRYELLTNLNQRTNVDQSFYSPIVRVNTTTFKETALLLELTDSRTRKLVWQGSIDLKQGRKQATDDFLEAAILKMFNTYLHRANTTEQDQSLIVNE